MLFAEPMPLTLEDRLLDAVGEIARIEPDGVHSRWPERNAELCRRLEATAGARRRQLANERWQTTATAIGLAEGLLAERILGERSEDVAWCLDCRELAFHGAHAAHAAPLLFRAGERQTLAAFRDYLATDPLDPRLVEREGERAVLERLRHGDFGDAYRESWRTHAHRRAAELLRNEVRAAVRALRSPEQETDVHFTAANFVLSVRRLP